jgi:cell division protein FtsB
MRDELRQEVKDMQSEWELLDDDVLAEQCSNELSKFESIENRLEEI